MARGRFDTQTAAHGKLAPMLPKNLSTDTLQAPPAPQVIIIAGPNGAGKTTFAREFLPQEAHCLVFVNADLIAAGLSPFAPEAAAIKAGRIMLAEMPALAVSVSRPSFRAKS